MDKVDWVALGTLPDWLTFMAGAAAAVGAFILLRKQGQQIDLQARQLAHEVKRAADIDERAAQDRRIAQARRVHYRMRPQGGSSNGQVSNQPVRFEVVNNSDGVINHVEARASHIGSAETLNDARQKLHLGRLLPGESTTTTFTFHFDVQGLAPKDHPTVRVMPEIRFVDAGGVTWMVDHEHRLLEIG